MKLKKVKRVKGVILRLITAGLISKGENTLGAEIEGLLWLLIFYTCP